MLGASLFEIMDVGISGMFASGLATGLLNHNIANANTPGYSRQRLQISAAHPLRTLVGSLGRGVEITGVNRVTDDFLQRQLLEQTSALGTYSAINGSLSSVEEIMGSVQDDRIGGAMSAFFNAWSDLSTPPVDAAAKQSVVNAADALALQLREVDTGLKQVIQQTRDAVAGKVNDVNRLLTQVGVFNQRILEQSSAGSPPNDLLDQRDQVIAELSQQMRLRVLPRGDGSVDVVMEGRTVVTRDQVTPLRLVSTIESNGSTTLGVRVGSAEGQPVTTVQGEIAGLLRVHNDGLARMQQGLDDLAQRLISGVNALQRQGRVPGGAGVDLFEGTGAGDIAVRKEVADDASLIATGRSGEPGDNSIALEIAQLGDVADASDGLSLHERYNKVLVDLASQRSTFSTLADAQRNIVQGVSSRLESVRGVSIDEETADLIRFQKSFEANARVISAVNEMLDTIINQMI